MRNVIISDCHGRPELVYNALADAGNWDRLVFAGDFLDIGPEPGVCLGLLREAGAEMLWGNHEQAILYGEKVFPQDAQSWTFKHLLHEKVRGPERWKIATIVDDFVVVSHAGFAQVYTGDWEKHHYAMVGVTNASWIDVELSESVKDEFWEWYSPLWFRPDHIIKPLYNIVQIVGHTPPEMLPHERVMGAYYSVDPYARDGNGDDRFRYAVVENGNISLHDSNTGVVNVGGVESLSDSDMHFA